MRWLKQLLCSLSGHEDLREVRFWSNNAMSARCMKCGKFFFW